MVGPREGSEDCIYTTTHYAHAPSDPRDVHTHTRTCIAPIHISTCTDEAADALQALSTKADEPEKEPEKPEVTPDAAVAAP